MGLWVHCLGRLLIWLHEFDLRVERIIGFTLGFDQVVTSADIMSASNASPNPSWQDQCFAFDSLPGACLPQHAVACPDGESQNSAAELLAMFGPAVDP